MKSKSVFTGQEGVIFDTKVTVESTLQKSTVDGLRMQDECIIIYA